MMPSSEGGAARATPGLHLVEWAAALLMGAVTLLVFVSAVMRYVVATPIPDAHDLGRLALGVAIFWGVASVNYAGSHITVDLVYEMLGRRGRLAMDLVATALVLGSFAVLTVMMGHNAADVYASGEYSYDLRLPIWPAYWLMVAGAGLATLTTAGRLWWLVRTGVVGDGNRGIPAPDGV